MCVCDPSGRCPRRPLSGAREKTISGLIELIETIGLPPREGVHGQTGFGLKPLMCVDSFIRSGFRPTYCGEIEDFTFPIGLQKALKTGEGMDRFEKMAPQVFEIKKKWICSSEYRDKYKRPQIFQNILKGRNNCSRGHVTSVAILKENKIGRF